MDVVIHCDFGEVHSTRRTLSTSTRHVYDVSKLEKSVVDCLYDWLPNLHVKSAVSVNTTDRTEPGRIIFDISVKNNNNVLAYVQVTHPGKQRYAIQTKWTTAEQLMSVVKPGDKIEMKGSTSGGLPVYSHFAVYTGFGCDGVPYDHDIIHLAPPADSLDSELAMSNQSTAKVRSDNLISYAKDRLCRINNLRDLKNEPRPGDLVVTHANNTRVTGVGKYNLVTNNCEHLANNLRYGKPVSDQVNDVTVAAATTVGVGLLIWVGAGLLSKWVSGGSGNEQQQQRKK